MNNSKEITKKQIIVIGAGPAGLSAAHELLARAPETYQVTILEASQEIGGISRTVCHNNLRMDIGGHRFFSKEPRVNKWWHERMPLQGVPAFDDIALSRNPKLSATGPDPAKTDRVMLWRQRLSRIYYEQEFFDYPILLSKKTLAQFGMKRTAQVITSYIKSRMHKLTETNLENFYINRFGKKLYSMFFESYTEKLWGEHPSKIAADWGAQRVKGLSVSVLLANALKKRLKHKSDVPKQEETSLISAFEYPKLGPGQLWEQAATEIKKMGGNIEFGKKVVCIKPNVPSNASTLEPGMPLPSVPPCAEKPGVEPSEPSFGVPSPSVPSCAQSPSTEVICADGSRYECDYVFSSMPLSELVVAAENAPAKIKNIAADLPYRDFLTVGLLVKKLATSCVAEQDKKNTQDKVSAPDQKNGKGNSGVRHSDCGLGGIIADNWIYVQNSDVAVGRVQIFNNWSPYMLPHPEAQVWLGLEYFTNEGDELSLSSDAALVERAQKELAQIGLIAEHEPILDSHVERVPKAYPAYFGSYAAIDKIIAWANEQPWLFCIGRNGQHRYNNMDHSMMTAFLAVDCLLAGKTDRSAVWQVNAEAHYHEELGEKHH